MLILTVVNLAPEHSHSMVLVLTGVNLAPELGVPGGQLLDAPLQLLEVREALGPRPGGAEGGAMIKEMTLNLKIKKGRRHSSLTVGSLT